MTASVFAPLGRVLIRAFADRSQPTALWIRHDLGSVPIACNFDSDYAPVSIDGMQIADAAPTLWVALADARRLAPSRPLKAIFDNRDTIVFGGVRYAVESCKADGQAVIEITLFPAEAE